MLRRQPKPWRTTGVGRHCPARVALVPSSRRFSTVFWGQLAWSKRRRFNKHRGNPLVRQPGTATSPCLVKVSWVLPALCNSLPAFQLLATKLSRHSLGRVQEMACPRVKVASLACAVELVWAEQLGQDGFSTVFVPFLLPGSERKLHAVWAGCTPPPAASSIPEDVFSASTPGLSMDRQQKGHRWDRGALYPGSSPGQIFRAVESYLAVWLLLQWNSLFCVISCNGDADGPLWVNKISVSVTPRHMEGDCCGSSFTPGPATPFICTHNSPASVDGSLTENCWISTLCFLWFLTLISSCEAVIFFFSAQ